MMQLVNAARCGDVESILPQKYEKLEKVNVLLPICFLPG